MLKRALLTALAFVAGASTGLLRALVGTDDDPAEDERRRWAQMGADAAAVVYAPQVSRAYLAGYAAGRAEGGKGEQ